MKSKHHKAVFIGDAGCGKTSIIYKYVKNKFPTRKIPIMYDDSPDKIQTVNPFDTASGPGVYDSLRMISYSSTDVIILCFSIADRESYNNCKNFWYQETQLLCPKTPVILAGTKSDLYSNFKYRNSNLVSYEEGVDMANQIQAVEYIETSALNGSGIEVLFETALGVCKSNPLCDDIINKYLLSQIILARRTSSSRFRVTSHDINVNNEDQDEDQDEDDIIFDGSKSTCVIN